ncbi:MAG: LysR family transcriptional regulator [Oscillospiraceae bacterium]|jgi:DNA-binding transcriptional LysR family regulator|nr:LysR family transcriptional regulator [Oscillospiraceae bacterium]
MTEKQIQYFFAVYRHGSITTASEELYVSRPVISRAISEIERAIGVSLFDRKSSGITPTKQGAILYGMLDEFARTYDITIKKLRSMDFNEPRDLRVGILEAGGGWFYSLVYRKFHEMYPDINMTIESIQVEKASKLIIDGLLDTAISPILGNTTMLLGSLFLYNAQWVLCAPKNSVHANAKEITLDDTSTMSVAILETLPPPFYKYKKVVLSTREPEMVRIAVENGYAHAILPSNVCSAWGDMVILPFSPPLTSPTYLLWNKAAPHNSAFDDFMKVINEIDFEPLTTSLSGYRPNGEPEV